MDMELAAAAAQFGTAGVIGWMWLTERRAAMERDRQVAELHERIVQERGMFGACLEALKENTRAITNLEGTQRSLAEAVRSMRGPQAKVKSTVIAGKKGEAA
jgi:hypothetical protein